MTTAISSPPDSMNTSPRGSPLYPCFLRTRWSPSPTWFMALIPPRSSSGCAPGPWQRPGTGPAGGGGITGPQPPGASGPARSPAFWRLSACTDPSPCPKRAPPAVYIRRGVFSCPLPVPMFSLRSAPALSCCLLPCSAPPLFWSTAGRTRPTPLPRQCPPARCPSGGQRLWRPCAICSAQPPPRWAAPRWPRRCIPSPISEETPGAPCALCAPP